MRLQSLLCGAVGNHIESVRLCEVRQNVKFSGGAMFRIVLSCEGIPMHAGPQAARDIANEFINHRTWHKNVTCTWDERSRSLILQAESEFDNNGLALRDEFSDAITANVKDAGEGDIRVVSATKL